MSRIKLLQLITLSEMGGAQKVLYHLVAGLDRNRFDITVACAPGGDLVRWLAPLDGVRVVQVPHLCREISPARDLCAFWFLYRLMRREGFAIVHCHSSKAGILGRLAARLAGVRGILFTVHGWGLGDHHSRIKQSFFVLAEKVAGRCSDRVVCVSRADYQKALDEKLVPPDRLAVIHNGLPRPAPQPPALREELGLSEKALMVGTVCRLRPPKDPLFFLEVARALLYSGKWAGNLYFVLIGDGPLMAPCREYVQRHGLSRAVFFLGNREDAPALVAGLDVFVLFSLWEGLPLTVIEAMQAGKPVVAPAVGGVGELVTPGETGYLIKPRDLAGAVQALETLLKDGQLRRDMGAKGRRAALEHFSVERMVADYLRVYDDLLRV